MNQFNTKANPNAVEIPFPPENLLNIGSACPRTTNDNATKNEACPKNGTLR